MAENLINSPRYTLAAGITSSAVSLTLSQSGTSIPTTGVTRLTLSDAAGHQEIVTCTGRTGSTLTGLTRQAESASDFPARAWLAGDIVQVTLTKAGLDDALASTNPMTAQDDLIVGGASGARARLAKGTDGQVLTVDPTTHHLVWATPPNPMTTKGDLIAGAASGVATRLPVGSNGQVLQADSAQALGVKWAAAGGGGGTLDSIFPLTAPPNAASWTFVNQDTCTKADNAAWGVDLAVPSLDADMHLLTIAAPTAPYTRSAGLIFQSIGANFVGVGVGVRDSGTGRLRFIYWNYNSGVVQLFLDDWVNEVTFSDRQISQGVFGTHAIAFFRIQDNATNIIWFVSADGNTWVQVYSASRTAWVANPNQLFWFVRGIPAYGCHARLVHWT